MSKILIPKLPFKRSRKAQNICTTLNNCSISTWDQIGVSVRDVKAQVSETTLTENILINLSLRGGKNVSVIKFSGYDEMKVGADWALYCHDKNGWLGARIQAKKLYLSSGRYEELKNSGTQQNQKLINSCGPSQAPVYIFYNSMVRGLFEESKLPQTCCQLGNRVDKLLGCTVASAHSVKGLINSKKFGFDDIHPMSLPFKCLFCCPERSNVSALEGFGQALNSLVSTADTDQVDLQRLIVSENPPEYVRRAIVTWELGEIPEGPEGISHLVVFHL